MARAWWNCNCCSCSPNLTTAGARNFDLLGYQLMPLGAFGHPEISTTCGFCTILIVHMRFATEALARHYVGDGNYFELSTLGVPSWYAGPWVLFSDDAGTYSRDESRPMPCVVTTEEHPTIPNLTVITSFDLNNGQFIWTRASDDPASPNYTKFTQTTGSRLEDGAGFEFCLGINVDSRIVGYVFPWGEAEDITVTTSVSDVTEPCASLNMTICLEWAGGDVEEETNIDGWYIGTGIWTHEDETDGTRGVLFTNGGGNCYPEPNDGYFGVLDVAYTDPDGIDGAARLQFVWPDCNHDVRDCPEATDFELAFDGACSDGSLDSLACTDCEGGSTCPPEDCLASYCKWQWNVATQEWDLIFSSCVGDAECPDPPPDPDDTEVTWVECLCCVTPSTPGPCPSGTTACESTCTWTWSDAFNDWLGTTCTAPCSCESKPGRVGLFDGETVDGICCEPEAAPP